MTLSTNSFFQYLLLAAGASTLLCGATNSASAQAFVPGTGTRAANAGDDMEDAKWKYVFNVPKSSHENDSQQRLPAGSAANGRWFEGVKRGQPDVIERVPTPEGGIPGSQGSLLMRSLHTGVPGSFSRENQQDDLIVNTASRLGGAISVSRSPSVVVRVYLPPWEEWEQRTGNSFGFRVTCNTHKTESVPGRWGRSSTTTKPETYWPGMFIHFTKATGSKPAYANLLLRAGSRGHDFYGPTISEPGWWTLGMSFSPDGQVHYYAHAGVENLTSKDYLSSQFPYSYHAESVESFFFNIVNGDNGAWSTNWIIDDPSIYYLR